MEIVGEPGIGKTRLAEELRERAEGLERISRHRRGVRRLDPYVAWRELLREAIGVGWEDADEVVLARLGACVSERAPELRPWLPLLAVPFDVDPPRTPEVDALAPEFRRARLHRTVIAFLRALLDRPTLIECDDAQYLDEASADLFAAVAREVGTAPWLVLLVRREAAAFAAPESPAVIRLEPGPLAVPETRALAEAATDAAPLNPTLLELSVERSGGNPQFLRDLLRAAAEGDGDELPESLEAAAMARIDRLDPEDRTIIRHASVLGAELPPALPARGPRRGGSARRPSSTWVRLEPFFQDDGDGYLRFRRVIVRDAAYAGLPYRTRRRLHAAVGRADGARVRLDARRGRRHALTALPSCRRARQGLALRARGGRPGARQRGVRGRCRPLPPRPRLRPRPRCRAGPSSRPPGRSSVRRRRGRAR